MLGIHLGLCATVLLLLSGNTSAQEEPFGDVEFELTTDPTAMVLHVYLAGGSGTFTSMGLYGDGRMVLKEGRRRQTTAEHVSVLSFQEMRRLVALAADHGLAEWDGMAFQAKSLEMNAGKPLVVPEDAARLRIMLSLASYQRGALAFEDHQRQIDFYGPYQVKRFYPGIREVEGMVAVLREMDALVLRVKKEGRH